MSFNPFSLEGHTILVTGASSGIGRCTAVRASQMGARLVLLGRDKERLNETAVSLEGEGHKQFALDLLETDKLDACLEKISDGFLKDTGPLNGIVHSAGISDVTLLRDVDIEKADGMMRLNWLSFMAIARAFCRRGRYAPGMSVVALSSVSAMVGQTGLSTYAASKAALAASVRSLASEYAPRGIRFNCVSPGPVDTPMQQRTRERLGEDWYRKEVLERAKLGALAPEDVAGPVLFLLSDAARRITGTSLLIDGGWSLA